jgi:rubrerythrin
MAAPFFKDDLEVLNYALTLEHLEAAFYTQVNGAGVLTGDAAKYLKVIGDHETAHVSALTDAISKAGGTPVKARASYDFSPLGDLSTQEGVLQVAMALEGTGVKAYDGAASEISDKSILGVAGQIVQVEARHAGLVRTLVDPSKSPAPHFEDTATPQQILDAVTPLLGPEQ